MARSAVITSVSVSVAELLAGVGSVRPDGAAMVAVFTKEPVAEAEIVATTVYVAVAPTAKLMVSLRDPEPEEPHVAPAVAAQVQVAPVREAGSESATTAPVATEGPRFLATMT